MRTETLAPAETRDFDFLTGAWHVAHRRLKQRWVGCDEWDEFAGTSVVSPVLDGVGNVEQIRFPTQGWAQAFSVDGGRTWETNWTMDFTRAKP